MDEITKIETVDQYDQLFGLETLHPLVNVIDFSKATRSVEYIRMNIGFYCLFLKDAKCGDLTYGRKNYDYQEGTVVCMAPGQVSGIGQPQQACSPHQVNRRFVSSRFNPRNFIRTAYQELYFFLLRGK